MSVHMETDAAEEPMRERKRPAGRLTGRRLLVTLALAVIIGLALMEVLTSGLGLRPYALSVPYVGAALLFAATIHYERDLVAALLGAASGFLAFRVLDILVHNFLL